MSHLVKTLLSYQLRNMEYAHVAVRSCRFGLIVCMEQTCICKLVYNLQPSADKAAANDSIKEISCGSPLEFCHQAL